MTFDEQYGTDTEGFIGMDALTDIISPNKDYATGYEPTPVEAWQEIIGQISSISMNLFTFIDIGSGKGRVLVLASLLTFKSVIGVEFSPKLAGIAANNLHVCGNDENISPYLMDAVIYEFPPTPLVVYMYNPFERPITAIVMANLEVSLHRNPREAWLLQYKPTQQELIEQVTHFRVVKKTENYTIFTWRG